jgi:hypothetical protein
MTAAGTVRKLGVMAEGSDEQRTGVELTVLFWQRRTSKNLSAEDARQMIENVAGFLSQLDAWDVRQGSPEADARSEKRNITAIGSEPELTEKVCNPAHDSYTA